MDQSNDQPRADIEPTPLAPAPPDAPLAPAPADPATTPAPADAPVAPAPADPATTPAPADPAPPPIPPIAYEPVVSPTSPVAAPSAWAQAAPPTIMRGGVTAIARFAGLLIALIGVLWLVVGAFALAGGSVIRDYIDSSQFRANGFQGNAGDLVGGTIAGIGIVLVAVALIEIIAGVGALAGRDWGRVIGILYCVVFGLAMLLILAASLRSGADVNGTNGSGAVVGFILAHVIVYAFALFAFVARWRRRIA